MMSVLRHRISSYRCERLGGSVTPNDRIFEIIGSYAYCVGFSMLRGDMNQYKRLILSNQNPKDATITNKMIDSAMSGNVHGAKEPLRVLQRIIGVFNYLIHDHL
jgi:chitinase